MKIRTHVRAGTVCQPGNTNCKGVDLDTGRVFWDNCHDWRLNAGKWCWEQGESQGIAHPYCYKC